MRVTFLCNVPTTLDCIYMDQPFDLKTDDDRPILPREYVESVVVSAARRFLSSFGKPAVGAEGRAGPRDAVVQVAVAHAQKVDRALRRKVTADGRSTRQSTHIRDYVIDDAPPYITGY